MQIMAIDDDPIILELLSEVIGPMTNHSIITATSAKEALTMLARPETPKIDCFLLDIQMPEMDGIDLCRALRRSGAYPFAPILMLTAMNDRRYIDAAFAAGASDYITKPFEVNDIQLRIRQAEHRAARLARQIQQFTEDSDPTVKPKLDEPFVLYDINNVIDHYSLCNYVPMISGQTLSNSVVAGFHIRKIAQIHQSATPIQFRGLIEDVAEIISDALRNFNFLMSYAGNGTYLCVVEQTQTPDCRQIVDQINLALHQLDPVVPKPDNTQIRVCTSDLIPLIGRRAEMTQVALTMAKEMAEKRGREIEIELDTQWFMSRTA